MKILIVEDDVLTSALLLKQLEEAGHEVTGCVRTLLDAIKSLRKSPPEFAILDIALGEEQNMDGIELANWIGEFLHIPFLFLSGKNSPPAEAALTQSYGYIRKPYDKDQLLIQIRLIQDRFWEDKAQKNNPQATDSLYLHVNGDYKQIRFEDLLYVQANRGKVIVHTVSTDVSPYVIGTHLGDISRFFIHPLLISLPPSFIINRRYIKVIKGNEIELQNRNKIHRLSLSVKARKLLIERLHIVKTKSRSSKEVI
jgi:DNA-binding response OmpR family regulator